MGVDILVLTVLVLRQLQGGQLRQHVVGQPGVHHQVQAGPRLGTEHQLVQLRGDTLHGDPLDLRGHVHHRLTHPRLHVEAQLGGEAAGPQHAQRIVVEGLLRGGGGVQHPVDDVVQPVQRVAQFVLALLRQLQRQGVAAEVAAHQIALEGVTVADLGVSGRPVVGVGAEGGDLHDRALVHRRDRAEVDAGVPHRLGDLLEDPADRLGPGVGGEVEVVGQASEQCVPYRTADEVQAVPGRTEGAGEAPKRPVGGGVVLHRRPGGGEHLRGGPVTACHPPDSTVRSGQRLTPVGAQSATGSPRGYRGDNAGTPRRHPQRGPVRTALPQTASKALVLSQ